MSVRILRDIEEAISREVRRITFQDDRTPTLTVLKDTFDPITGENIALPVEANFYDSSVNARQIQYPHFFVKLLRMREDRFSNRVEPQYGKIYTAPVKTSPKAYEIIVYSSDGLVSSVGNNLTTTIFKIKSLQPGNLLRIFTGNNIGTYKISSITPNNSGVHTITVSNDLLINLPEIGFESTSRTITFLEGVDLSTIKIGDTFTDSTLTTWNITAIDSDLGTVVIDGIGTPSLLAASKISRIGSVFQNTDLTNIKFTVMDGTKPVFNASTRYADQANTSNQKFDSSIPIDVYYLVRIDSKERDTHIDVANRMWEEFNPPRTALPTVIRSKLSVDQKLKTDVASGGSFSIEVEDNSDYLVGDTIFIFDELTPTKASDGKGFQEIFTAKITDKINTTELVLNKEVPDTFTIYNNTRIVSNAEYCFLMFHFVDHNTRDVEAAQYWSHEFTFWVQAWVDRQGEPAQYDSVVQKIGITGELLPDENIVFED